MTGTAGGLNLLLGRLAEGVCTDRQFRADLAAGEDLHGVGAGRKALGLQRVRSDLIARLEPQLEIGRVPGWVLVRKFSKGIDFFMCGPRSFRIRM